MNRERTQIDKLNMEKVILTGKYDIPIIRRIECSIPKDFIPFNFAKTYSNKEVGIHFFIDDYQFERIWNYPRRYINMLKEYRCVCSPDFSLYVEIPLAQKIWNVYRSHLLGQFWQSHGINTIPTLQWADPRTYDFCFAGIEKGSIVAVSTLGAAKNVLSRHYWREGMTEAIKRTEPEAILLYGTPIEYDFGNIPVFDYHNQHLERLRKLKSNK